MGRESPTTGGHRVANLTAGVLVGACPFRRRADVAQPPGSPQASLPLPLLPAPAPCPLHGLPSQFSGTSLCSGFTGWLRIAPTPALPICLTELPELGIRGGTPGLAPWVEGWSQGRLGGRTHLRGQAEDLLHQLLGLCRLLQKELHDSRQQLQLHLRTERRQGGRVSSGPQRPKGRSKAESGSPGSGLATQTGQASSGVAGPSSLDLGPNGQEELAAELCGAPGRLGTAAQR